MLQLAGWVDGEDAGDGDAQSTVGVSILKHTSCHTCVGHMMETYIGLVSVASKERVFVPEKRHNVLHAANLELLWVLVVNLTGEGYLHITRGQ